MSLDLQRLEKVRQRGRKTIARCPACAASGGDRRGEHLVIFEDGRFGCAACPKDTEHRKQIWEQAGVNRDPNVIKIATPVFPESRKRRILA